MTTKKLPLETRIVDMNLSIRATSRLMEWLGPEATLEDLLRRGEAELWKVPFVGPKTVQEVLDVCDEAAHPLPFLGYTRKLTRRTR
jgi:hypothetical protein